MTRRIFAILISILFISCTQTRDRNSREITSENKTEVAVSANSAKIDNALKFINDYVVNCNKMNKAIRTTDWVNSNQLATENFKSELTRIMNEASKTDPESGLDFDPIFDAQDFPDNGFVLESFDTTSNFLIVKGKDENQFRLTMKVRKENEKWLVEGCGIVNIPKDRQIKRESTRSIRILDRQKFGKRLRIKRFGLSWIVRFIVPLILCR